MRILWALLPFLLLGCRKDFDTVEEACHDKVPGEKRVSADDAVDALWRTNCYRRVVKLSRGRLHPKVQEGTENHLDYLLRNVPWTGDFRLEEPGRPGFTGQTIYDRMEALDYVFDDPAGWGIWEAGFIGYEMSPTELVDYHAPDPFMRQLLLQPSWVASGYAEGRLDDGTPLVYWTIFYSFPNTEREDRPVVYPKDGQLDVPYEYRSDDPNDSLFSLGEVGFPITVTFSASNAAVFDPAAANPHAVNASDYRLVGDGKPVKLRLIVPPGESSADILRYTLVFVPETPLQPGTEYTFQATVTWSGEREKRLETVFTTAKTPDFRTQEQTRLHARTPGRAWWHHAPPGASRL